MRSSVAKNTNKKRLLIIAAAIVLAIGSITAGLAYYIHETEEKAARYSMAFVSCEIHEEFDGIDKTSITIQNTSNVPAYIRVRLVSYWQTPSGKIAGRSSSDIEITPGESWKKQDDNTWIYSEPVEPGAFTGNLLKKPLQLMTDEEGYIQVVKVLAEAIQTDGNVAWDSTR